MAPSIRSVTGTAPKMISPPACRLYLVTPPAFDPAAFAPLLAEALDAGDVACVQLRLKLTDGNTTADILANDQLLKAEDYKPLIVGYHNGAAVKLSVQKLVRRGRLSLGPMPSRQS